MEASTEVSAHRGAPNPLAPLGRSWRRLRRRPLAMQLRTVAIVSPSSSGWWPGSSWRRRAHRAAPGSAGAAEVASAPATGGTPLSAASTSTRGISANTINVVFPVVAINSEAGRFGFAQDKEYNEQTAAINLYVNQINNVRWHQRAQDQPDDRQLRSGEQRQHAVALPAMDAGQPGRVRRRRRHRDVGRGQPALRHRAGPHPADQRVVHHDQLDADGLPLPVVDRARPVAGARRHRAVGPELGPPGPRQEGRSRRLGPGGRPGRTQ